LEDFAEAFLRRADAFLDSSEALLEVSGMSLRVISGTCDSMHQET
jgi:hypothetical protein